MDGTLQTTYDDFLKLTGEPIAAAMLTLAKVLEEKPDTVALTVKQAAKSLGVNAQTVYRMCAEGRIRHQKIGRSIRIQPEDLRNVKVENSRGGKHVYRHIRF